MDNKSAIISDLKECKKIFEKMGIPWIIMGGTLLGYARYNDIMPWDTDLDVGVFVEITNEQWNRLDLMLLHGGFRFSTESNAERTKPGPKRDFNSRLRNVPFDLWFFHKNGNFYESFPIETPGLKYVEKAEWYNRPQVVNFLDDKYPIPNNLDDFLTCHYGKNWETNIIENHEAYYLELRGDRLDKSTWSSSRGSKTGDLWPKRIKIEEFMDE